MICLWSEEFQISLHEPRRQWKHHYLAPFLISIEESSALKSDICSQWCIPPVQALQMVLLQKSRSKNNKRNNAEKLPVLTLTATGKISFCRPEHVGKANAFPTARQHPPIESWRKSSQSARRRFFESRLSAGMSGIYLSKAERANLGLCQNSVEQFCSQVT